MFSMLQVVILTIVALVLVRLMERASISDPENQKEPAKNADPSEAEVVSGDGEYKPVNRIKKYRF